MNNFTLNLNKNLNNQFQTIDLEELVLVRKAQKSIRCIKKRGLDSAQSIHYSTYF